MVLWRRWLVPGLLLTALLTLLALAFRVGTVERELVQRADARLAADGQAWASVAVDGRDVTLLGTAPSTPAQVLAAESVARVFGARVVLDGSGLIPLVSPFVWTAERRDGGLRLTGSVPSPEVRAAVRETAASVFPGSAIADETADARGVPENFLAGAGFALGLLRSFDDGSVTLTDTTLSLRGIAPDQAAFAAAQALGGAALPQPFTVGTVDVLPPRAVPFLWSARLEEGRLTLRGGVPDEATRAAIGTAAGEAVPAVPVSDEAVPSSGEPAGFRQAAAFALSALGRLTEGEVRLADTVLSVSGRARSVDDYEALLAQLETPPPGYSIGGADIDPAAVEAYFWQAVRTGSGVTLSGYVPSEAALGEIRAAAAVQFPDLALLDSVRVADGAPTMDWIGAIKFALSQLALLQSGTVGITGRSYQISGVARSVEAYQAVQDALGRTLPASLELGSASVSPPIASPYRLAALPEGAAVALEGFMPDQAARQAVLDSARRKFGDRVTDRLALAGGAPEGFAAAVEAGLQAASRLAGGRMELVDTALSVSGTARFPGAAASVESALRAALPDGFGADIRIDAEPIGPPVAAGECQDLLSGVLASGRIEFPTEEASILPDSFGLLDRLVAVLQRCPDARVEIGGHTDSDGSAGFNLRLSTERANAVLDFLVDAGVLRERLSAVGYGETRPIASNASEEGKAQNRRIEFTVLEE